MCIDAKDFYLNRPMYQYEYVCIPVSMIQEKFIIKYNLYPLVHKGYINVDIWKGMYRLPQSGRITQDCLQKHLSKYD